MPELFALPPRTQPPERSDESYDLDVTTAHPARVWAAALGSKDAFDPDKVVTSALHDAWDGFPAMALTHRYAHGALVSLTYERVTSWVDCGAGLPRCPDPEGPPWDHRTEETARRCVQGGDVRVVAVDVDRLTTVHNMALRKGALALCADVRETEAVLAACAEHLGDGPRAYLMTALAELIPDADLVALIGDLRRYSPPGSLVGISHTDATEESAALAACWDDHLQDSEFHPRSRDRLAELLTKGGVRQLERCELPDVLPGRFVPGPVHVTIAAL